MSDELLKQWIVNYAVKRCAEIECEVCCMPLSILPGNKKKMAYTFGGNWSHHKYGIWSRTFSCLLKWCLNSKATKNKWCLSFFSSCWDKLPKKSRLQENGVCSGSQSEGTQSTMVEKLRWQELEASHRVGKEGWMPSAAQVLLPAHTVQNPKQKMTQCTIKIYFLLINIIQIIPYNTGSLPS